MPSKVAGGFLRTATTFLYVLAFCCAAVGLGIYSYFLARLDKNNQPISNGLRAVEGLTGAAVLYTLFAVLLTCFLGGKRIFAILGVLLDLLFCGAMIAVAVLTRHGASSCRGNVETPFGNGLARSNNRFGARLGLACRLNTAVFATALIAALLFLLAAIFQVFMMRHHQKEKKYGPSPKNNYTSGSGRNKFWKRKPKTTKDAYGNGNAELAPVGRPSHETGYTGTTVNGTDNYGSVNNKYDTPNTNHHSPLAGNNYNNGTTAYDATHSTFDHAHAGPGPTAGVNPYGYSNAQNTHPTGTAVNY